MIPKPEPPSAEFDRLAELAEAKLPDILADYLERLYNLTDDELEMEYQPFYAEMAKSLGNRALDLGNHALEKDALKVDPLRYPLPTQAHLDAYAAEYGKPQAEPNPAKPSKKRKRPAYWNKFEF